MGRSRRISQRKSIITYITTEITKCDLDGGRCYILSTSGVIPLLFDYLYHVLKYSKSDYREIIYNSTTLTDDIEDMYDQIHVVRDKKIDEILSSRVID